MKVHKQIVSMYSKTEFYGIGNKLMRFFHCNRSYCIIQSRFYFPDFGNAINGIIVLGVVFLQTNFGFLTRHFWRIFLHHSKFIVVLSLNLKRYFTCVKGLTTAILANLWQLTRDMLGLGLDA